MKNSKAFIESRYTYGTTSTKRQYTGQINEAEVGLYFYNHLPLLRVATSKMTAIANTAPRARYW
jgi:hypothetical protein